MNDLDINLRSIDLNLLTIFESLMQLKNVSHSAKELGMTQPAVSHALKRLQVMYDDPLFERKDRVMEPTLHAMAIFPILQATLHDIRRTLPIKGKFEPKSINMDFKINIQNLDTYPFIIKLVQVLAVKAPNIRLVITNDKLQDKEKALRNRKYDLEIDVVPIDHVACFSKDFFHDSISIYASKNHPRLGRAETITKEQFFSEKHAVLTPSASQSFPLEAVSEIFKKRVIAFVASTFTDISQTVKNTEYIAVMPTSHYNSPLSMKNLNRFDFPFDNSPNLSISMSWHSNVNFYKPHKWCRDLLIEITKEYR